MKCDRRLFSVATKRRKLAFDSIKQVVHEIAQNCQSPLVNNPMSRQFQEGEATFRFENGDIYTGHFCAHISGLVWRQGKGNYVTHDGQIYEGIWKDDRLDESKSLQIIYDNKDQFIGQLKNFEYCGPGSYKFNNGSCLTAIFANNKPISDVIVVDRHGQLWFGCPDVDNVVLSREHVFSSELNEETGKKPKLSSKTTNEPCSIKDLKQQHKKTKSTKPQNDINFEDSDWYREFQTFKQTYETISSKIRDNGLNCLSNYEESWYRKFLRNTEMVKKHQFKLLKSTEPTLLKKYYQTNSENTCSPIQVLYSSLIKSETF